MLRKLPIKAAAEHSFLNTANDQIPFGIRCIDDVIIVNRVDIIPHEIMFTVYFSKTIVPFAACRPIHLRIRADKNTGSIGYGVNMNSIKLNQRRV